MGRILCITGMFDVTDHNGIPTGKKELLVSHGIDEDTGKAVILPCEHPARLGAQIDIDLNEYVLST